MANPLDGLTQPMTEDDFVRSAVQGDLSSVNPDATVIRVQPVAPLARKVAQEENPLTAAIQKLRDYIESLGVVPDPTSPTGEFNSIAGVRKAAQEAYDRGTGNRLVNKITGAGGEERFQFWPERMLRSGFSLPHDVMTGQEPIIDPATGRTSERVIERAQDMAGLAGGSTLFNRPGVATLGSGATRPNMRKYMEVNKALDGESGYMYHATNLERAEEIANSGIRRHKADEFTDQTTWPDGSVERRNYFTPTAKNTWQFAPEEGMPVLLRVKQDTHPFKAERGTGDYYSVQDVPSSKIEYLSDDGRWLPIKSNQVGTLGSGATRKGPMKLLSDTSQPGMAIAGAANASKPAPVFYSALEHAAANAAQKTMSPQQWLGWLKNQPGVKQEELQWTGLGDWLAEQKGNVSKTDVQRYLDEHKVGVKDVTKKSGDQLSRDSLEDAVDTYIDPAVDAFFDEHGRSPSQSELMTLRREIAEDIRANPHDYDLQEYGGVGDTKYGQYQLPGGENYREHLLTLPPKTELPKGYSVERIPGGKNMSGQFEPDTYYVKRPDGTTNKAAWWTPESAIENELRNINKNYHSSHWDEPNVLAHVRTNDREMPIPYTAEEQQAIRQIEEAKPVLAGLAHQQREIFTEIRRIIDPLEKIRRSKIGDDMRSGKLSRSEALKKLEEHVDYPEIKSLQDRLDKLHAEEDRVRAALPKMPEQRNVPTLHLEEIQSDWHQAGRNKGYQNADPKEIEAAQNKMNDARAAMQSHLQEMGLTADEVQGALARAREGQIPSWLLGDVKHEHLATDFIDAQRAYHDINKTTGVPDAPFKTSWAELALKRMIRMATEEGKDRISWTPGEAQAARYDLSKQVRSLSYQKNNNGTYKLSAEMPDRRGQMIGDAIPVDKLADHVGKEIAEKITKGEGENVNMAANNSPRNEWNRLSGVDLKIGGEGMKGFYDDILPKTIEKLGKKYGVKVHKGETGPNEYMIREIAGMFGVLKKDPGGETAQGLFKTHKDAEDWIKHAPKEGASVYYFDIPPAWKDQALSKGFPLFTSGIPFPLKPVDYNPFTNKDAM